MSFTAISSKMEHALRSRLQPLSERARHAWAQRTRRERSLLQWAALVIAAALVWLLALQPAIGRIRTAQAQLPSLQDQAGRLNTIILEAKALDRGRVGALSEPETEDALVSSLASNGLQAVAVVSRAEGASAQWQVDFTNAPAARIVDWMANLPFIAQVQTRRVELLRSRVDGRDRPGQLTGKVEVAMPDRETP